MLQKEAFYFDDLKDLSVADTFDKLSTSAEGLTREEASLNAKVLRDGTWQVVPSRELVPVDIVRVRLGDIVPADIKLISGDYVQVDESALTGESLPVEKHCSPWQVT